ncbi:GntR family transcriptional regulator [Rhodospirillaceae bacterium SYSU D60014]|uniref:GntR family transcriptional regulator n=1 Tax=Virgifigura deserti TaxID=2268457 RepID=UPI000E66A3F7
MANAITDAAAESAPAADETSSLTARAYKELEEQIVTLQIEPGSVLSETMLAKRLDIGRTPIREALQRLAREGLVVILPRRGILVSEINVKRQLMLLEVRRELERLMARTAAVRMTDREREQFVEIAEGMERAAEDNDDLTFMRYDQKMNGVLSKASRNVFASNAMTLMQGLSRRFWYLHYKEVADLPLCARLHAQMARGIASGDGKAAAQATDKLLDYIEEFTRATLDARGSR